MPNARWSKALIAGACLACALPAPVPAAGKGTLRVGLATEPISLDPHFSTSGANQQASYQIFEALVGRDRDLRPVPGLALSWRAVDPLTWEFKLRRGVKFHDGGDFTAADVISSVRRIPRLPESPSSYKRNVAAIRDVVAVDPHTVRFLLKEPTATFPLELSFVFIIRSTIPADASQDDFNRGRAAIGTGPLKFVEWVRGDRLVLERNEKYWGTPSSFERIAYRPITSDPARVAALLAGDVDLVDQVSPVDRERLKGDPRVTVLTAPSSRLMYVHMDSNRDISPFVTAKDGSPLPRNPLKDPRVRKALSLAINREAIVQRVLNGAGHPTGQIVGKGMVGWAPDIGVDPYDPSRARALLAEAGFPDGFAITLHSPNDRFESDEQVAQAVAQFLARLGLEVKVQALPYSVFSTAATKLAYSAFLMGIGNQFGDAGRPLNAVLATHDKATGAGANNRGRFSDPEVDRLLREAAQILDAGRREALLQQAARVAIQEKQGIIPLYFQSVTWAMRKGLRYEARMDEFTFGHLVSREPTK